MLPEVQSRPGQLTELPGQMSRQLDCLLGYPSTYEAVYVNGLMPEGKKPAHEPLDQSEPVAGGFHSRSPVLTSCELPICVPTCVSTGITRTSWSLLLSGDDSRTNRTQLRRRWGGGARLGTEKYFHDLAAMIRRRLCISFQDWTGAALNRSIQGLIDHMGIGSVSTEQLLEQLKATLQLSQSVGPMALHWIAPSPTTYYCIKGIKHYKESLPLCLKRNESVFAWLHLGLRHYSMNSQQNYSCGTKWPVGNETMHYTGDRHRLSSVKHVLRYSTSVRTG